MFEIKNSEKIILLLSWRFHTNNVVSNEKVLFQVSILRNIKDKKILQFWNGKKIYITKYEHLIFQPIYPIDFNKWALKLKDMKFITSAKSERGFFYTSLTTWVAPHRVAYGILFFLVRCIVYYTVFSWTLVQQDSCCNKYYLQLFIYSLNW